MLVESFLEASARRSPDKIALVCGERRYRYDELEQWANRLARALQEVGVERGDRVLIQLDNSPEAVVSLFAALKAGLGDEEILELTYITCTYDLHATMCRALRLEYDNVDERIVEIPAPDERANFDVMADISQQDD